MEDGEFYGGAWRKLTISVVGTAPTTTASCSLPTMIFQARQHEAHELAVALVLSSDTHINIALSWLYSQPSSSDPQFVRFNILIHFTLRLLVPYFPQHCTCTATS